MSFSLSPFTLRLIASGVLAFFIILLFVKTLPEEYVTTSLGKPHPEAVANGLGLKNHLQDVRNATLGFEKVFSIGFENRGDRRDTLMMASSLTGIDIIPHSGVAFDEMSDKSIHESWHKNKGFDSPTIHALIGSQRAHFNVLDYIMENHISTALILEDDVDWDFYIKDVAVASAQAFRGLQNSDVSSTSGTHSPYGDDWDFLAFGYGSLGINETDGDIYVLHNDPTVPPVSKRHCGVKNTHIPDFTTQPDTRVAFPVTRAGTFAYAVTYRGAQKIIAGLSLGMSAAAYDSALNGMFTGATKPKLNAFAIYPPIISTHRFAGPASKDSDISNYSNDAAHRHPEYTWDIVFSAVQNARRLLDGANTVISQWPGLTVSDEMSIHDPLEIYVEPTRVVWKEQPTFTDHPVQRPTTN